MTEAAAPVLYVEDEDNDVLLMKLAFKKAGVGNSLHVVTDGRQAIEYLLGRGIFADRAQFPLPRLVLLDLNLPQMDGFSVLEQIRTHSGLKDLRVVIFTSSAEPSDQERARELGADDYAVKPSQLERLGAFVEDLREKWLTSPSESNFKGG